MTWEEECGHGDVPVACTEAAISARRKGRQSGDEKQGMGGYFLFAATQC